MKRGFAVAIALLAGPWQSVGAPVAAAGGPALFASPNPIDPGDWLIIQGTGFTPNATATVGAMLRRPIVQRIAVSSGGYLNTRFYIPAGTPSAIYAVSAQVSTFTPIVTRFQVIAGGQPVLEINPSPIDPGQWITLTGENFTPRTPVRVLVLLPRQQTRMARVGAAGTFTARFPVSAGTPNGIYAISAQASRFASVRAVTASFSVLNAPQPTIFAATSNVPGGRQLTVQGSGFKPNTAASVADFLPQAQTKRVRVSAVGTFLARFRMPTSTPPGRYRVSAQVSTFSPVIAYFYVQP